MRFEINYDSLPEYVSIKTEGVPSPGGIDALLTALVGDPKWKTGTKQLVDHRKLKLNQVASEDMRKIINVSKKHSRKLGDGCCAFVVSEALGFGFTRMYELIGGDEIHRELKVFYEVDEAVAWLKTCFT